MKEGIDAARQTLYRLADAFGHMTGRHGNSRSEHDRQVTITLSEWKEEFGANVLEKHAEAF